MFQTLFLYKDPGYTDLPWGWGDASSTKCLRPFLNRVLGFLQRRGPYTNLRWPEIRWGSRYVGGYVKKGYTNVRDGAEMNLMGFDNGEKTWKRIRE